MRKTNSKKPWLEYYLRKVFKLVIDENFPNQKIPVNLINTTLLN